MSDLVFGRYGDKPRPEMIPFVPTTARRVLDVGCFGGAFGAALAEVRPGIEVWGVEPHEEAATLAAQRLDHVVCGAFPDDIPAGERFDTIVFNDVLEHMVDPWSALAAATEYLASGGTVVASIPNVRHFSVTAGLVLYGRWRYQRSGILDRSHLRFFTRAEILELFESCGLVVRRCEPIEISAPTGPIARLLHLTGRFGADFLNVQFAVVAERGR